MDNKPNEYGGEIKPNEILDRIVRDPANPNVKRITGFLMGKSDKEDYWRLYLSVDLNHYLEFKKEDTLHAQQFRTARTVVWLANDAKVIETMTHSGSAEFLTGNLLNNFLRRRGLDVSGLIGSGRMRLMEADGSGCAHTGCSAGCTPGYGCGGGGGDTVGYTCGC
jgi:hypothetical protein